MKTETNRATDTQRSVIEQTWQLREQDMSYREIAEKLDIPQGTVMSRLARARRMRGATADHQPRGTRRPYPPRAEKSVMETARALQPYGTRLEVVNRHTVLIVNE